MSSVSLVAGEEMSSGKDAEAPSRGGPRGGEGSVIFDPMLLRAGAGGSGAGL